MLTLFTGTEREACVSEDFRIDESCYNALVQESGSEQETDGTLRGATEETVMKGLLQRRGKAEGQSKR